MYCKICYNKDMTADEKFMRAAIKEALKTAGTDDVPVGAVIVRDGKIIARGRNVKEARRDATAHAEMLALLRAQKKLNDWRLLDCTLYVTLEPCAMCAGAVINCRLDRLVFGAYDKRFGCCGTLCNLPADPRFNHRAAVEGGVLEQDCAELLRKFFKDKRV